MVTICHLPATLLNASLIERSGGDYRFWREGVTPSVARLIEIVDAERLAIARSYGVETGSFSDWIARVHDVAGETVYQKVHANQKWTDVRGPGGLNHRFITEDVPMGLVPMVEWARAADVETPVMETMIHLAGLLNGEDYRSTGRTLQRMGLAGADQTAILRHVSRLEPR